MDLKRAVYWNLLIFWQWEPPLNWAKNGGVTIHIPCGSIRFRLEHVTHSLPYSQGVVEGKHFYQATQNGAQNAIVFARQS